MPTDRFKVFWTCVIIVMMAYTATYMPFQICFLQDKTTSFQNFLEYFLDVVFGIDIVINFMSAYENDDGTVEPRLARIAINYLKFWFYVDIFAVLPVQLFDPANNAS